MRIISIFLFILISNVYANTQDINSVRKYADCLINEGYYLFHDKKLSKNERDELSAKMLKSYLYLDWMAKTTLGMHRKKLSDKKINEFIKVYSKFVISSYVNLSKKYDGEKAVLKDVKQISDQMFIVNTQMIRPNSQFPVKIDYLIYKTDDKNSKYRVADIITEGVSIINSQQSEFNSVISMRGLDWLIKDLKSKTEKK